MTAILGDTAAANGSHSGGPHSPRSPSSSSSRDEAHHNDELLRGQSRREFHERQRQAMLRRARQASSSSSGSSSNNNNNNNATTDSTENSPPISSNFLQQNRSPRGILSKLQVKLKLVLLKLAQILASATLSPFEGPHTLMADTHPPPQHNYSQQQVSVEQAGRWMAKLQLAHFCLTGLYPTWMHRFTGHQLVQEPGAASKLYHQPTTARLVGFLLLAQAVAAFIQASSSTVSRWCVLREERRRRSSTPAVARPVTPAVVFQSAPSASTGTGADSTSNVCSICKMERTHPAAPSSCGHVFCWKCLVQWVSAVRPECPLCRSECPLCDIIALFNYTPTR